MISGYLAPWASDQTADLIYFRFANLVNRHRQKIGFGRSEIIHLFPVGCRGRLGLLRVASHESLAPNGCVRRNLTSRQTRPG